MKIRTLHEPDWEPALALVWETFLLFEAPDYSPEGVETFQNFIGNRQNLCALNLYGIFDGDRLCGVAATRKGSSHLSLLFVRKEFQGQGIGRMLIDRIQKDAPGSLTVHSSPYAVEFYRRMGFQDTDVEQLEDGIRFTPMKWTKK